MIVSLFVFAPSNYISITTKTYSYWLETNIFSSNND